MHSIDKKLAHGEQGRRVYGRRAGKPLGAERADAMEALYPQLKIRHDPKLTPKDIFGVEPKTLHFEIGIGNGEHLKHKMETYPDDHFIGAEIFRDGMAAFLKSIKDMKHDNIRVHMDDAVALLNAMPDACIDYLYILNPDPWPKKRHWNRRMVVPENLDVFARVMKPGAILLETTDVDDLAEWMAIHTNNHPAFEFLAEKPEDWRTAPDGWMATRYENKGKNAGRQQSYLRFRRK